MYKPFSKKKVEFEEESQPKSEADEADNLGSQLNKFQFLENQEVGDSSDEVDRIESDKSDVEIGLSKTSTVSTKSKSKNRRRNKNKRKAKNNRSNGINDLDDIVSISSESRNAENKEDHGELVHWAPNCHLQLVKIDVRHLTPENELIRMFGKSVIKEERARETKSRHQLLASSGHTRSRFVSTGYHDNRAILLTPGPKMELDSELNCPISKDKESTSKNKSEKKEVFVNDKKPLYFRYVHEKSYQTAHNLFLDAAQRGYSDGIVENLNLYPTHLESLIQLSDMIKISEDYKTASELIERALLLFERGFHQLFNFSGNCRLTYLRPENRSFFITIFKHIYYLSRRGLRRTPLEYTKLLLSLDPDNDPLFATLLIDFYAVRSEEYDFLIEFITKWQHLSKLPNMNFSLALAHYMKSKSSKRGKAVSESSLKLADEYLQQALIRYPNFIITLLNACSAEPDPALLQTDYFNYSIYSKKYKLVPESVSLLMSIYVERNLILWNKKDVLAWLERNTALLVKKFASKETTDNGQHLEYWSSFRGVLPRNLLRHIVLSELKVKVPQSASGSTNLDIDPFPPTNSINSYVRDNASSSSTNISNHPLTVGALSSLFIRTILPSYGVGNGGSEESENGGGNNSNS